MGDVADQLIDQEMFGRDRDLFKSYNRILSHEYEKQVDWQRKQLSDVIQHMFFDKVGQEFNRKQRARKRKSLIKDFCVQNNFVEKPGVHKTNLYRSQSNYTFKRLDLFKEFLRSKRKQLKNY